MTNIFFSFSVESWGSDDDQTIAGESDHYDSLDDSDFAEDTPSTPVHAGNISSSQPLDINIPLSPAPTSS